MTNLRHDATLFGHPWRLCISLLLLLGGVQLAYETADAQSTNVVYLVRITDEIDLGLAPFLARVLDQANDAAARAVILEIDTPGGRLDAALQIRTTILDSRVRTIAYVNREALSAGALIAIAADEIYMAPGAVIGAATPVDGTGEPADTKTISAVRSIFRATAELRERDG
ncbi:MAG TPA: ATP-dependent Clp protease proteolytic subunit [Herpetosiphonaceae bacterium]|nr:ATP-dependent Clp protease proteolytic subunit [Herpetosiphonaceae bacterium]